MDDGEYFQTLPENSVFIFLRSGEIWRPEGTDAVRAGKSFKIPFKGTNNVMNVEGGTFPSDSPFSFVSDGRDSHCGVRHAVLDGAARPDALLEDHGQSGQDHGEPAGKTSHKDGGMKCISTLQVVLHWEKDLGALGMPLMPAMIAHQTSSTSAPSRQSSVGSTTIAAGGPSRLVGIKVVK